MTRRRPGIAGHVSGTPGYSFRGAAAVHALPPARRAELAGDPVRLPAARAGRRAPPAGGRLRARREPRLEPRPVAARAADLPAPFPALHGEIRAVLVPAR